MDSGPPDPASPALPSPSDFPDVSPVTERLMIEDDAVELTTSFSSAERGSDRGSQRGLDRASVRSGVGGGGGSGWRPRPSLFGIARGTLGIGLLLVTVFLWTTSNFLASSIFSDETYDKPFFVVYVNSSIFAIYSIPMLLRYTARHGVGGVREAAVRAWREQRYGRKEAALAGADSGSESDARLLFDEDGDEDEDEDKDDAGAGTGTGTGTGTDARFSALIDDDHDHDDAAEDKLSFGETARLGLDFSLLWFTANYLSSACLRYTSVGSATILTSTSSIWTLVACALLGVESFTMRKLAGVAASLAGIALVSTVDLTGGSDENRGSFPHKSTAQIAAGDAMALVSAVVYGLYVTVMKRRVGNEDRVRMPVFFGLVGVFNLALIWPGFVILHLTGMERFEMPPTGKIWAIIMANSIFSFVSDMCWAYAMLFTSPLVVTVGLSLTIPLSLIGEMLHYSQYSSAVYWIGAAVVFLSFIVISRESLRESAEEHPKAHEHSELG